MKHKPSYRVITWNLRYDNLFDRHNSIADRLPLIRAAVEAEQADIIGFQEVRPHTIPVLEEVLEDYILVGRPRDAAMKDEHNTVAIRKDRFRILEAVTHWLSPEPDVPGSRYPDQSPCPRIYVSVLLQDRETDLCFRYVNTHYDHESDEARREAQDQLFLAMEAMLQDGHTEALIVGGDLNLEPENPLYAAWGERGFMELSEGCGGTFHDFGRIQPPVQIDYLFAPEGQWEIISPAVCLEDREGPTYLSDHYPVAVTVRACV